MTRRKVFSIPPPGLRHDLKSLLDFAKHSGTGRKEGSDGQAVGIWTAEKLAEAISKVSRGHCVVDVRTVQLWFQNNDKGISTQNIRWLSHVFGGSEASHIDEWREALTLANKRLSNTRRKRCAPKSTSADNFMDPTTSKENSFNFAMWCNRQLSGSLLRLPATIFGGATALIFLSNLIGNHSVVFPTKDGSGKQVGFLWAPNWTIVFILLLPSLVLVAGELLGNWQLDFRNKLTHEFDNNSPNKRWSERLRASCYPMWLVFFVCIVFGGVVQWISTHLLPLVNRDIGNQMDWASIAVVAPDKVSIMEAIVFSGLAYLYMGICLFIFFASLILLTAIVEDYSKLREEADNDAPQNTADYGITIMHGVFRCTVIGLLIAICIKMQEAYMESDSIDIANWLYTDILTLLQKGEKRAFTAVGYSLPIHMESLLLGLVCCFVYIYGAYKIDYESAQLINRLKMSTVVIFLVIEYLMIGAFRGFSLFVLGGMVVALYCLFNPTLGLRSTLEKGN